MRQKFLVPPSLEITPEAVYLNRRQFLKQSLTLGAALALVACKPSLRQSSAEISITPQATATADELGDPLTPFSAVTGYNNYYEFTSDKERVAALARNFRTHPWTVVIDGLVNKPQTLGLEDIQRLFPVEERVYRFRCVEGWSMVIPWLGFPLRLLLERVEPLGSARYMRFVAVYDPEQMPGQKSPLFPWPYTEGLRLDEALHDLTLVATGLYGHDLLPQNGAPLRLVVPWKYGFKSIKGIVRMELTAEQPATLWSSVAPEEYGFYANVNPDVPHPRWSQTSERRIGENGRRPTLPSTAMPSKLPTSMRG